MPTNPSVAPDLDHALAFLTLIDPNPKRVWHFRCVHPHLSGPGSVFKISGSLYTRRGEVSYRSLEKLVELNRKGFAVYVVINEGGPNPKNPDQHIGDKAEHITRICALFVDCDKPEDGHMALLDAAEVPYNLLVETSPGKHHAYWLTSDQIPLEGFTPGETALIRQFKSDVRVKDKSRVLRVPGFYHTKNEPWTMSRMLCVPDGELLSYERELAPWLATIPVEASAEPGAAVEGEKAALTEASMKAMNNGQLVDSILEGGEAHPVIVHLCGRFASDGRSLAWVLKFFKPVIGGQAKGRPGRLDNVEAEIVSAYGHSVRKHYGTEIGDMLAAGGELPKSSMQHHACEDARVEAALEAEPEREGFAQIMSFDDMMRDYGLTDDGQVVWLPDPSHILSLKDFHTKTRHNKVEYIDQKGNKRSRPTSEAWVDHHNHKAAAGVTFKAGGAALERNPRGHVCFNTWNGWKVAGVEGDAWPFYRHVAMLFGDRADDFLDWLAHIIQRPGVLPHTAWLHVSSFHGTGRNWISEVLGRVMRGHVATSVDLMKLLGGGYNERISQQCLAVVDEIRVGGSEKWVYAEAFKHMVTASSVQINPKYGRQRVEFNACRWLMFSNHRSAMPIEDDDRRTECVVCDKAPQSEAYFVGLYGLLDDPAFISAVMWALATRDISAFNPGARAKDSWDKQSVKRITENPDVAAMRELRETCPYALVTMEALLESAGAVWDKKTARYYAKCAEDAKWISIGRFRVGGDADKKAIFCKQGDAENWKSPDPAKVRAEVMPKTVYTGPKVVK